MAVAIVKVQFEVDNSELQKSGEIISDISKKFGVTEAHVEAVNADLNKQTGVLETLKAREKELLILRKQTQDPALLKKYEAELKNIAATMGQIGNESGKAQGGLKGFLGGIGGSMVAANLLTGALQGAISGIKEFFSNGIKLAAQMEQNKISFENFTGSAENAGKLLKEIEAFGAKTPFEFPELVNATKKLLAFGVSTDKINGLLTRLGDLAAGTGKPIEELANIYGKLMSKGKASMEELNQLTEAGIPILSELAKVTGKTTEEVIKMVETGKIGFKDVNQAIENMTSSGGKFAGLTEKQSKSLSGQWSTLTDNVNALARSIGEKLMPFITSVVGMFNNWFGATEEVKKSNEELLKTTTDEINSAQDLLDSYDQLAGKTKKTAADKAEMNRITRELATSLGDSVIQFNNETGAMELNRSEVLKQIEARAALQSSSAQALLAEAAALRVQIARAEAFKETAAATKEQLEAQNQMNTALGTAWRLFNAGVEGGGQWTAVIAEITNELLRNEGSTKKLDEALKLLPKEFQNAVGASMRYETNSKRLAEIQEILIDTGIDLNSITSKTGATFTGSAKETNLYTTELENLENKLGDLQKAQKQYGEGSLNFKLVQQEIDKTDKEISDLIMLLTSPMPDNGLIQDVLNNARNLAVAAREAKDEMQDFADWYESFSDPMQEKIAGDIKNQLQAIIDGEKEMTEWRQAGLQTSLNAFASYAETKFQLEQQYNERLLALDLKNINEERDAELRAVAGNAQAEAEIKRKYDAKEENARRKAAEQNKEMAIKEAQIQAAIAIIKTFAQYGFTPAGFAAAAGVAITTAAQIAIIQAQTFAKGGYTGQGIGKRDDTGQPVAGVVHAREFVFDRHLTAQWKPIFDQIHEKRLSPADLFPQTNISVNSDSRMIKEARRTNEYLKEIRKRTGTNQEVMTERQYLSRKYSF